MKRIISIFTVLTLLVSCSKVKEKAKETINKGGETVGKTTTEFFDGVSEGIDKTLQCELLLSESLKNKGLKTGKYSVENSGGGSNNQLTVYFIFDKDFNSPVTAKVFDKSGLEIGRAKIDVEGKTGDAKYLDFIFDKRSYIEVKSKITLE
ncbi:MAG: hypothetical protein LBE36_01315 [Flavobacteriaceae bacterium]|jgi:hypothetical protein|nr:hypothetical protein [Flavobacteriaceae bacterium]